MRRVDPRRTTFFQAVTGTAGTSNGAKAPLSGLILRVLKFFTEVKILLPGLSDYQFVQYIIAFLELINACIFEIKEGDNILDKLIVTETGKQYLDLREKLKHSEYQA